MKSFKLALLTIATALVLQGCNDDNSDFNPPPTSSDIDTNIVGFWSEDETNGNLSAISFMDDGTYVQVQVNNNSSADDPEGGLEWGEYSIDKKTGKLTTTQRFDENGNFVNPPKPEEEIQAYYSFNLSVDYTILENKKNESKPES